MDASVHIWIILLSFPVILLNAKDMDLYCGGCHMLVDEISWEISQTDPKKTIQVGSFRIMPDGTQRLNEIPYKQSGVQLSELIETACSRPNDYYQTTGEKSGQKIYKRQNRRDGRPSSLNSVTISKETNKMLKFACETVAEDFEEEIIEAFKNKEDNHYMKTVCVEIADVCREEQLYDVDPDLAVETNKAVDEDIAGQPINTQTGNDESEGNNDSVGEEDTNNTDNERTEL